MREFRLGRSQNFLGRHTLTWGQHTLSGIRSELTLRLVILLAAVLGSSCSSFNLGTAPSYSRNEITHVVKQGETLERISSAYGISPQELIRTNNLRGANPLRPGQQLLVPYAAEITASEKFAAESVELKRASLRAPARNSKRAHLLWPVADGSIVSAFGPRKRKFHDGVDFSARYGTPVRSAHDGVIEYVGKNLKGYGQTVIVRGDDRLFTVYAHNQRILKTKGQRVTRGEVIAEVGSTGRSSGPHLHFEVRTRDARGRFVAVDPLPLLGQGDEKPRYRVNESLTALLAHLGD